MTPERWSRVQAVFDAVADLPDGEREARLAQACGDDEALRLEVLSLLVADAQTGEMLDAPPPAPAPVAEDAPLAPGTKLGEYVLQEALGEGGFGRVYRAVHPVIRKTAAVKVLYARYSASEVHAGRFINEARTVNEIGHPDIIDIFAFGETSDGCLYFVMELVAAGTLEDRLGEGPMRLDDALPVLRRLAAAVDAAHAQGVIHRDLKPANILLVDGPEGPAPKLLDFGIAKLREQDAADADAHAPTQPKRTADGQILGTPVYMSPEQARGQAVGPATDVYALGIVAYQMLTGRVPFVGKTPLDTVMQHLQDVPAPPSEHVPELPPSVDAAIAAMLAKDAEARPATCAAAIAAFEFAPPAAAESAPAHAWIRPALFTVVVVAGGALAWMATVAAPDDGPTTAESARPPQRARDGLAAHGTQHEPGGDPRATPATPISTAEASQSRRSSTDASPIEASAIAVEFFGAPEQTTLLDADARVLGTIPGAIELPASETPLRLLARKRGYRDEQLQVLPVAGLRVDVQMKRRGPKLNKDLETPFGQ